MKLKNIKAGQVLKFRNGNMRIAIHINGKLEFIGINGFIHPSGLEEDLTHRLDHSFDVVEVYDVVRAGSFEHIFDLDMARLQLRWKRETELTLQQIADEFGIPIQQLRIKE